MEGIIFCDFEFKKLAVRGRCISCNRTVKFRGWGSFELHLPLSDSEIIAILEANKYLLCVQGEHCAVVTAWRLDRDIAIFGKSAEWLMTKFVIPPSYTFDYQNLLKESAVHKAVLKYLPATLDGDLKFQSGKLFEYSTYQADEPRLLYDFVAETMAKLTFFDSYPTEVTETGGFRLRADLKAKSFVFESLRGAKKRLLLSQSNRTAHDLVYTCEAEKLATGGVWYLKRTSDSEGNTNESWAQTAAGSEKGLRAWSAILTGGMTEEEAKEKCELLADSESIECETRRLEYGKDYALGDQIRLQYEAGDFKKTIERYVSAVEIYYDTDGCGVRPCLEEEL